MEQPFVLVIDNFHAPGGDDTMVVGPFDTWELAVEYARRRTRDSLEEQREGGGSFLLFGESCSVSFGDKHYSARDELDFFRANPATAEERDWQSLTPNAYREWLESRARGQPPC